MEQGIEPKKSFLSRFWWLFLIIILLVGAAVYFYPKLVKDKKSSSEEAKTEDRNNDGEENCTAVFSSEFTDFAKIDALQPIGSITGASRGRSYITVAKNETVPVYAPMDATLVSIIYAFRGSDADQGEYGFKFDAGCGVTFLLDHLDTASDEMKKYAPAEATTSTATNDSLSIPVKAGTLLGYTNGTPQARTFDFLVINRNIETFHINPARWEWEQSLYSVCPYDLYEKELKDKYYQKIGTKSDAGFEKAESCGLITYDIADTISGGWFLDESATDLKGEFLLIGAANGQVDLVVKNDSEKTNLRITDYTPLVLPKDVGIGESACYKGFANDWAYVHLIDSQTLEIASGSGACPASFPASGAKKYYR